VHSHRLRHIHDAILVGVNTVIADNPELTTRLEGIQGRQPLRVVVDSQLRLRMSARVVGPNTLIATTRAGRMGAAEVVKFPAAGNGQVALQPLLDELGARGILSLLVEGGSAVHAVTERVPGDISSAAFWLVAGAIHPDAELTILDVGVNPTRRAVIEILRSMGADITERRHEDAPDDGVGEPMADLTVRSSELRAVELEPADVAAAIDEIPVLCLAASVARGTTVIRGAGELRLKESDRIDGTAAGLRALGARIDIEDDTLHITGPIRLQGAETDSLDDHRLAITFAIAGLTAAGETTIGRPGSAAVSYPGFFDDLERVRA
jgi:3-phosphoshikimate 1-carboxyvinyltransferase